MEKVLNDDNDGILDSQSLLRSVLSSTKIIDNEIIHFGHELEDGNVEFKLKLLDPSPERFEHLASQLKWRLSEGYGEALYELGVHDSGYPHGLSPEELEKSLKSLEKITKILGAEMNVLCLRQGKYGKIAEVLIREVHAKRYIDVRIAVCGNVDSGKSTLIGVLTNGKLDNGRGLVRVHVFNHRHEVECGRTSSISQQILGFNAKGECINNNIGDVHNRSWGDIVENSCKVISFLDLAGHEKYLKTTVSGMVGQIPDYCFLVIGANMGIKRMTKEHLGLALSLKIPVIIILTKIDIAPANVLQKTIVDINNLLKIRGVRKITIPIKTDDNTITALKNIHHEKVVPVFLVSNVTGEGLDMIRKFLNAIPPRIEWKLLKSFPTEFLIDETYFITGVGAVVGGTVIAGTIRVNEILLLGPDSKGCFFPVQVKSVHSKHLPVKEACAGTSAGIALKKIKRNVLRKGMVLISPKIEPVATTYFEANVIVLYHSTTIHRDYQPVMQCLNIRQAARILYIEGKDLIRTGDRANVIFKFLYNPEYMKKGMRVIFRESRCKAIGVVTRVSISEEEVNKLLKNISQK